MVRINAAVIALLVVAISGCAPTPPHRAPTVPPAPTPPPQPDLQSHLEGVWESPGKNGSLKQLTFGPSGDLTFRGGLEYYNPGRWTLEPDLHELRITLPNADDDKLQIFKTYVGDGVKAFDHVQKQITYHFDEATWTLNIGGWIYTKVEKTTTESPAEPILK
jgi:hypothetical protein